MSYLRGCIWQFAQPNASGDPVFIFRYNLDTDTWERLSFPTGTPKLDYYASNYVANDGETIYLITTKDSDSASISHLYRSDDSGDTWTAVADPTGATGITGRQTMAGLSYHGRRLYTWVEVSGHTMFAYYDRDADAWTVTDTEDTDLGVLVTGSSGDRVLASPTDPDKVWIVDAATEFHYNGNAGTLADWVTYNHGVLFTDVICSVFNDSVLYAVKDAKIYKLTANGAAIAEIQDATATGYTFYGITESPFDSQTLLACGSHATKNPILISKNGGATWAEIAGSFAGKQAYQIAFCREGTGGIYARCRTIANDTYGTLYSTNGTTWTYSNIHATNIESGTGVGALRSFTDTDASKSWTTNEWKAYGLVDSAGTIFTIASNDATTLTLNSGTPASGAYYLSYVGGKFSTVGDLALFTLIAAGSATVFVPPEPGWPPEPYEEPIIPEEPEPPDPPEPPRPIYTPVVRPTSSGTMLVYDETKNAWSVYDGLPDTAVSWNHERRHIVLCGDGLLSGTTDCKALCGLFRYGLNTHMDLVLSFHGLNDVFKYKRVRHVEVQLKGDAKKVEVHWEFDGNEVSGARDEKVYTAKGKWFGSWALDSGTSTSVGLLTLTDTTQSWATNEWAGYGLVDEDLDFYTIVSNTTTALTLDSGTPASGAYEIVHTSSTIGEDIAYYSDDETGGTFTRPLEKKYRFVCPQGGLGTLARIRVETEGEGEITIERVAINFVMAP